MMLPELDFYSAAPGFLLHACRMAPPLEGGVSYSAPGEPFHPALIALMESGQVVVVSTGSPQLDYRLRVHLGGAEIAQDVAATCSFNIAVVGGLCVRDGFDLLCWREQSASLRYSPVPDGVYSATAAWVRSAFKGMEIELRLQRTESQIFTSDFVVLDYVAE